MVEEHLRAGFGTKQDADGKERLQSCESSVLLVLVTTLRDDADKEAEEEKSRRTTVRWAKGRSMYCFGGQGRLERTRAVNVSVKRA